MKQLRFLGMFAGVMLFLLAVTSLYFSARSLMQLVPAEAYEDQGIHTFYPQQVLPTQVKNHSSFSRDRRMNPTKTVYEVCYVAGDGSHYQWYEKACSRNSGQQTVAEGQPVERRVLEIPSQNAYITVEPQQTAEHYTASLAQRSRTILLLSGGYLVLYGAVWCVLLFTKRRDS